MSKHKKPIPVTPAPQKIQWPAAEKGKKIVLNIVNAGIALPKNFGPDEWQEIVASKEIPNALPIDLRSLASVPSESCNAIWNAGSLCYLYAHEVGAVLKECYRILQAGGILLVNVTDLQRVGQMIGQGKLENELYRSPAGPIAAIDLLFGHRRTISAGHTQVQIHTGFTASSIAHKLTPLGFGEVEITREGWLMYVMARKVVASPPDKPMIRVREEELNETMRKRDNIEKAPEMLKITPEDAFNV